MESFEPRRRLGIEDILKFDPPPAPSATREDHRFPFTAPAGSDASMFIQWKGTTVCLDFHCTCGASGHYDGGFAYYLHCPACDAVYQLGTQVIAKRTDDARPGDPSVQTLEVD